MNAFEKRYVEMLLYIFPFGGSKWIPFGTAATEHLRKDLPETALARLFEIHPYEIKSMRESSAKSPALAASRLLEIL
jgi:hypothetical protein